MNLERYNPALKPILDRCNLDKESCIHWNPYFFKSRGRPRTVACPSARAECDGDFGWDGAAEAQSHWVVKEAPAKFRTVPIASYGSKQLRKVSHGFENISKDQAMTFVPNKYWKVPNRLNLTQKVSNRFGMIYGYSKTHRFQNIGTLQIVSKRYNELRNVAKGFELSSESCRNVAQNPIDSKKRKVSK